MKYIFLFAGLFIVSQLRAQKDFHSFIPKDYDTLAVAKGDLNKDGIEDAVLVLYHNWEKKEDWMQQDGDSMPQRMLVILFGTENGYKQVAQSTKAILCKTCGGIYGDPFEGIEIGKGLLTIYHYGGSAWRWAYTHKFRYQDGQFYLIGSTHNSYWDVKNCDKLNDFAGTDYEDINYLTGQFERKRISENCKLLENRKGKRPIKPLISLAKFTVID